MDVWNGIGNDADVFDEKEALMAKLNTENVVSVVVIIQYREKPQISLTILWEQT